jgi:hypothetical protein
MSPKCPWAPCPGTIPVPANLRELPIAPHGVQLHRWFLSACPTCRRPVRLARYSEGGSAVAWRLTSDLDGLS